MVKPEDIIIRCGVEIEAEYDSDRLQELDIAPYHSENEEERDECECGDEDCSICNGDYEPPHSYYYFGGFKVEEDGSLCPEKFDTGEVAEFISKPFFIDDWRFQLDKFQKEVIKRSNVKTMSKVLSFNNTTGAHIHFSASENKYGRELPLKILSTQEIAELNDLILNKMREAFSGYKINTFTRNYYRSYALRTIREGDRYSSINTTCQGISHMELRSFHLRHCRTWEDFFKSYEIAFTCIKEFILSKVAKEFSSEYSIATSVSREEIESMWRVFRGNEEHQVIIADY